MGEGETAAEEKLLYENGYSPQFSNEVKRMRKRLVDHIENNRLRRAFILLSSDVMSPDPLLCAYFAVLIEKMEVKEKNTLIQEMIKSVHECTEHHAAENIHISNVYETTVDSLFVHALHTTAITMTQCIEGLVMTTDFTMRSRIDQRKWKYIKKSLSNVDYKGNRNILRYLLDSQFRRLPQSLTSEQVNELRIVEDVILEIIDRETNLLPQLMTLSEIMRGVSKQVHMMPRLSSKISQIANHFRPIADLTYVCGRSYIYPIPQHPCFVPYASFWESESAHQSPFVQSHHMLPYRLEHTSTFLYTLYMILRQPKGKDSFNTQRKLKTKSHWDGLLSIMICEAMAEAESLNENEPIPRYQWDNIMNIVYYGLVQQLLNPTNFFSVLCGLVKSSNYTRARDEVMWIVFQIVGTFSANTNGSFDKAIPEIVELYKVLFSGDVVWMGASDHPALFARFLAAPSTWMMLEGKEQLPPPNETIQSHIRFITDGAANFDAQNTAMLAALANAYRTETKVAKMVSQVYGQLLDGSDESSMLTLSYGRQSINKMTAFSVEFLDALTYRAKKSLLMQCFNSLRTNSIDKLPSPAVFDTVARICQAVDHDGAAKDIVHMSYRSLSAITSAQPEARDQCYYLFDFLCYRLPTITISTRQTFISLLINALNGQYIDSGPNHQLYELLEQYLMRQWCWTSFHENIVNAALMFGPPVKPGQQIPQQQSSFSTIAKLLQNPSSFVVGLDGKSFPICPEIFRMNVITLMRAVKITGQDLILENSMYSNLITGFLWPQKMTKYFPKWALELIANQSETMKPNFAVIQKAVRDTLTLHHSMTPPQFIQAYDHTSDAMLKHNILAVIYKFLSDNPDANMQMNPELYDIVGKKSSQDIVMATNFLVDFLIAEVQNDIGNNQMSNTIAIVLSKMVFQWNFIRADRLLISLVMRPTCDNTSHIAIQIVNEFCNMNEFVQRVKWFNENVPKKENSHSDFIRKVVEYHEKYPEHEIVEMTRGPQRDPSCNVHMPNYYGCLIERLLPIADFIISVTLEQQINHVPIFSNLSLLYKYHPAPIQFIYSILFTMFGLVKKPIARTLVLSLAEQCEDVNLTVNFKKYNHQHGSQEQILLELVDRLSQSLDFILTPPPFVCKDWKTAEFSPGAQTLYLSCIEIMASPHSPDTLVPALIDVLHLKPHLRPYNVVNLIALILTALPENFAHNMHKQFLDVLESGATQDMSFEELVFDTFEESQLLNITNRALSVNVISQAYWTHCNVCLLVNTFTQIHVPKIMENVKTENDLWYALRLIHPMISRFWEWQNDSAKQYRSNPEKFGPLVILRIIFEKVGSLAENGVEFKYEEHLCDLFYNCRYRFAGDFLRDTAIEQFAKLPQSMQELLKFYVAQPEIPPTNNDSSNQTSKNDEKTVITATNSNANEQEQTNQQTQDVEMMQVDQHNNENIQQQQQMNMEMHQQQHIQQQQLHHQHQMHLQHQGMGYMSAMNAMPNQQAAMHMGGGGMISGQTMMPHHPYMIPPHLQQQQSQQHLMSPHYNQMHQMHQ